MLISLSFSISLKLLNNMSQWLFSFSQKLFHSKLHGLHKRFKVLSKWFTCWRFDSVKYITGNWEIDHRHVNICFKHFTLPWFWFLYDLNEKSSVILCSLWCFVRTWNCEYFLVVDYMCEDHSVIFLFILWHIL